MVDPIALDDLYEASVWDAFSEQTKEVLRKVDKQLAAADELAEVMDELVSAPGYHIGFDAETDPLMKQSREALREYREASNG